jgi:hypothetical protein
MLSKTFRNRSWDSLRDFSASLLFLPAWFLQPHLPVCSHLQAEPPVSFIKCCLPTTFAVPRQAKERQDHSHIGPDPLIAGRISARPTRFSPMRTVRARPMERGATVGSYQVWAFSAARAGEMAASFRIRPSKMPITVVIRTSKVVYTFYRRLGCAGVNVG